MPDLICPLCHEPVAQAQPGSGPTVTCVSCGGTFPTVSADGFAAGLPKPSDASDTAFERRRLSRFENDELDIGVGRSRWRTTHTGLRLVFWNVLVMAVATAALSAAMMVSPIDVHLNPQPTHPVFIAIMASGCVITIVGIMVFVGLCMCCTAPDRKAQRWAFLGIAAIVLSIGSSFVFTAVIVVLGIQGIQNQGPQVNNAAVLNAMTGWPLIAMVSVQAVFTTAGAAAWMLFHGAIGAAFQNPSLQRLAKIVMVIWLIYTPINAVSAALGSRPWEGFAPTDIARIQAGFGLAFGTIAYGAYLLLCGRTIKTIRASMDAID